MAFASMTPVSSSTSRTAQSTMASPSSRDPPGNDHIPMLGGLARRISSTWGTTTHGVNHWVNVARGEDTQVGQLDPLAAPSYPRQRAKHALDADANPSCIL